MKTNSAVFKSALFLSGCLMLVSCNGGSPVEPFDIEKKIDEHWAAIRSAAGDSTQLAAFDICELFPVSGWDKVYTVAPYTPLSHLRELDLDNFHKVKTHFKGFKYSDFNVGLLFVKDNEIVQYSISSIKLNFSTTPFFTKRDCADLRLETASPSDTTHFRVRLKGPGR